jgi:hypothetical protein
MDLDLSTFRSPLVLHAPTALHNVCLHGPIRPGAPEDTELGCSEQRRRLGMNY